MTLCNLNNHIYLSHIYYINSKVLPVSALYSFPKIHTGSEVSGKSSNSPKRSVSYVKVAEKEDTSHDTVGQWSIAR